MKGGATAFVFFLAIVADLAIPSIVVPGSILAAYPVQPRFFLAALTLYAAFRGSRVGAAAGALGGAVIDVAFGRAFGPNALFYAAWGGVAGEARRAVYRNAFTLSGIGAVGAVLYDAYFFGLFRLFRWTEASWDTLFFRQALWEFWLTAAVVALGYGPARRWEAAGGGPDGGEEGA